MLDIRALSKSIGAGPRVALQVRKPSALAFNWKLAGKTQINACAHPEIFTDELRITSRAEVDAATANELAYSTWCMASHESVRGGERSASRMWHR